MDRSSERVPRAFVGRESEVAQLRAGLRDTLARRGRLIVITGEPGIGKTRLADELAVEAGARGARVLWGRCWEGHGVPAYWPWVQILRAYARDGDPALAPSTDAAELTAFLPELAPGDAAQRGALQSGDSEEARFRLLDAACRFLTGAADRQPLVLVLDDLHWADLSSVLLLHFLVRGLHEARILVVCTYREADVRRTPALAQAIAKIAREGVRLSLVGLSAVDAGELIHSIHPRALPEMVSTIHEATAGNPFFIDAVTRLLAAEGGERIRIPEGVREAIRDRLAPLEPHLKLLLAMAAVVGREVNVGFLATLLDGPMAPSIRDLLGEALAVGLLRDTGEPDRFAFSHALIRDVLRDEIPATRRMQLHWMAGVALENARGKDRTSHLDELAFHFFQAAPLGVAGKAIEYCVGAGEHALEQCAYAEAVDHYERALRALEFVDADELRRCELMLGLGEAQRRSGMHDAARDTFVKAATMAQQLGGRERGRILAEAGLGLGRGGETGNVDVAMIALVEQSLELLGEADGALRARVLARMATGLYFSPERERRHALAEQAVVEARRADSPGAVLTALGAQLLINWEAGRHVQRLVLSEELARVAEAAGDAETMLEGRLWHMAQQFELGEVEAYRREWAEYTERAERTRVRVHVWTVEAVRGMHALMAGRLDAAEHHARRALDLGLQVPVQRAATTFAFQMFAIRRQQGRLDEVEHQVRGAAQQFRGLPVWVCALALLDFDLGRPANARAAFESLVSPGGATLPRDHNWLPSHALLAELCAALGDRERARPLYDALLPFSGFNANLVTGAVCVGPVDYFLGSLAVLLGRAEEAAARFEGALALLARLGADLLSTRVKLDYVSLLLASQGDASVSPRAVRTRQLLAESSDAARALGLPLLEKKAVALLEAYGHPAGDSRAESHSLAADGDAPPVRREDGPGRGADAPHALFRKEGQYWTVGFEDRLGRFRDTRGLTYLHHLLRHPGQAFHALDLSQLGRIDASDAVAARVPSVDLRAPADPVLDHRARTEYRQRLRELAEEIEEARALNDIGSVERLQREIDAIAQALSQSLGLGGRDRLAISPAERARVAVTKVIQLALKAIAGHSPTLHRHLKRAIKTGTFCVYSPEDDAQQVRWLLD